MTKKREWHQCPNCQSKWLLADQKICTNCYNAIWHPKTEQEKEDEMYAYWNTECDMCGKEGAEPRKDGKNYCSTCWMVWNS